MKIGRELDATAFLISKKCLVLAGEQRGVSDCTNGSSGSDSATTTLMMLLSPATPSADPVGSTTDENQEPSSRRRKMDAYKTSKAEDTFR